MTLLYNMVILRTKSLLKKLQINITLKTRKIISRRDILDKCIDFVYERLEEFITKQIGGPRVTKRIIERLEKNRIDTPLAYPDKTNDELIYGS